MNTVNVAVVFFTSITILAHLFAQIEYEWKLNLLRYLGAQQYKNAWLMRIGFIGFGVLLLIRTRVDKEQRSGRLEV